MKILGVYKITYANGFVQVKNLISHDDYLNIIAPKRMEAYKLELEIYSLQKKDPIIKAKQARINSINSELKETFGEDWFTDKSPLFDGISTGILTQMPHAYYTENINIIRLPA